MKNVLELLENNAMRFPDKTAFADDRESLDWKGVRALSEKIGTAVVHRAEAYRRPVAVLMPRGCAMICAMLGAVYAGGFYTVVDSEMPAERAANVLNTLKPAAIIAHGDLAENAGKILALCGLDIPVIIYSMAVEENADADALEKVRNMQTASDPLYALFTSGSTGNPKGAVISHSNVLHYSKWFVDSFGIDENTVFGNQTPFYFSMSVSDIYATLRTGATLNVIPKVLFSFPIKLIEFLNERMVNTIYWVPSALSIIANWKVLDYSMTQYVNKVLFAGEVMPVRQLTYWRRKLPEAMFANLFGPTETTDICTYYVVDREFSEGETLPIGRHCDDCRVFVIKEDGTEASLPGEEGELYAAGPFVALGYYNNPEKTAAAFVQDPLNSAYPEKVYKTGDLVRIGDRGELLYISRKDFQIKHMGYRIELGEIEAAAAAAENVAASVALYDKEADDLVVVYQGKLKEDAMREALSQRLPVYMMPRVIVKVKNMRYNQNGKIDRVWLSANYKDLASNA